MEQDKKRESLAAGLVGAFLGSLLGAVCIIVVGQLGYVAAISGMVMAVCALKGYELLGGTLSRKGAVIACIWVLIITYVSYQLECAIQIAQAAEVGVFEAFRSISYLLEGGYLNTRVYWGGMVMLYLFTLVGAVPLLIGAFRGQDPVSAPPLQTRETAAREEESDLHIYAANAAWIRGLRLSLFLPLLVVLAVLIAVLLASGAQDNQSFALLGAVAGGLVAAIGLTVATLVLARPCDAFRWVFVRDSGTLWRVDLNALNHTDTYRYTEKNGNLRALQWERLTPEEQDRARQSIRRAIRVLCTQSVLPGSMLSRVVLCLPDARLERENKWVWRISYQLDGGGRKRMTIAKAYPDFTPTPDVLPPEEGMPPRWGFLALVLLLTAGMVAGGYWLGGVVEEGGSILPFGTQRESALKARVPETTTSYSLQGVTFQVDGSWAQTGDGVLTDPATGTVYTFSVIQGCDEDAALDRLLGPIGANRMESTFERFSFAFPEEEEDLIPMTTRAGQDCLYNLLTIYFTDGSAQHTAVCLAQDTLETLVVIQADQEAGGDERAVKETMLYLLEQLTVTTPTQDNYQEMYHRAVGMGYEYVGIALVPSPDPDKPFVRVPLPDGGEVTYLEDGQAVHTAAHGIAVTARIFQSPEGPQPIVEQAYTDIQAEGRDLYADGIFDTDYDAQVDMAVKQISFWEGENARISFLVAQPMSKEGYYRYMEITYQPEGMDDAYPQMVEELSDASDLTLPELDPF